MRHACLLACLCLVLALPARAGAEKSGALVVVVDPGHGGPFPFDGAHGAKGLVEKNIALQVSQRLKTVLEAAGATVVLTREEDVEVSLAQRAQAANEASADLFVSVHCNSMATSADRKVTKGVETYFLAPDPTDAEAKLLAELENGGPDALPVPKTTDKVQGLLADLALGQARNDSMELAATVHRQIIHRTGATSRGVRQAPFLVLAGVKMPAILVEIGFISHPQEGRALTKEKVQQRIAEAIAAGVQDFADKILSRRLFPPTAEEKAARAAEKEARLKAWKLAASAKKAAADAKALASAEAKAVASADAKAMVKAMTSADADAKARAEAKAELAAEASAKAAAELKPKEEPRKPLEPEAGPAPEAGQPPAAAEPAKPL